MAVDVEPASPVTTGMRGKDMQKFLMVAREYQVIILVRHTNPSSLRFIGVPGFYPKPAVVKAKTADLNPPSRTISVAGVRRTASYDVAGLVVHPGFHRGCFVAGKHAKAEDAWRQTLAVLGPGLAGRTPSPDSPESWSEWGVWRRAAAAPDWKWRVDVELMSPRFGCLMLARDGRESYIHGDYDLKDVIVVGHETDNRRHEGTVDGVKNYTPLLRGHEFETIRGALNRLMGTEMVQHGAEAQFAWHGDEPITVAYPDWRHQVLYDAVTVQCWYRDLQRDVLAARGLDYVNDRSRMFHAGPGGLLMPERMRLERERLAREGPQPTGPGRWAPIAR